MGPRFWFCGHCNHGPMKVGIDEHCTSCHRQRDSYATYQSPFACCITTPTPGMWLSTAGNLAHSHDQDYPKATSSMTSVFLAATDEQNCGVPSYYPALLNSAFDTINKPTTFGPPTTWYCSSCGDGPKNLATEVICVSCGHRYSRVCCTAN